MVCIRRTDMLFLHTQIWIEFWLSIALEQYVAPDVTCKIVSVVKELSSPVLVHLLAKQYNMTSYFCLCSGYNHHSFAALGHISAVLFLLGVCPQLRKRWSQQTSWYCFPIWWTIVKSQPRLWAGNGTSWEFTGTFSILLLGWGRITGLQRAPDYVNTGLKDLCVCFALMLCANTSFWFKIFIK